MPNRSRAILYTMVVFCAGAVAGALLMNLREHMWLHPSGHVVSAGSWDNVDRRHYIEQFKKELNLTETQSQQLEIVLDETMRQYSDLHTFSHHIRDEGLTRIRAMLDETQRKRFDEIVKKAEHQKPPKKPARPPSK